MGPQDVLHRGPHAASAVRITHDTIRIPLSKLIQRIILMSLRHLLEALHALSTLVESKRLPLVTIVTRIARLRVLRNLRRLNQLFFLEI